MENKNKKQGFLFTCHIFFHFNFDASTFFCFPRSRFSCVEFQNVTTRSVRSRNNFSDSREQRRTCPGGGATFPFRETTSKQDENNRLPLAHGGREDAAASHPRLETIATMPQQFIIPHCRSFTVPSTPRHSLGRLPCAVQHRERERELNVITSVARCR